MTWIDALDRGVARVENFLLAGAATIILSIMVLTGIDVVTRYAMNAPLKWSYDVVTIYLLGAGFFFAFSYTLRLNDHVAVDYFIPKWSPQVLRWLLALAYFLSAVLMATIVVAAAHETYAAWRNGEVIAGAIEWPVWLAKAIVPLGLAPIAVRLLLMSVRKVLGLPEPLRELPG